MEEILTSRFSVKPSVHAGLALARRSARFWMGVAAPLIILLIAGVCYDFRLLYVAAFVSFILFPSLLLIAWYSLLSSQSAVNGLYPQTVLFSRNHEISVRYYPIPNPLPTDNNPTGNRSVHVPDEHIIPFSDVTDCRLHSDYLVLSYSGGNDLLIPLKALPYPEASSTILRRFSRDYTRGE